jgi:hypothetical protein
MDIYLILDGLPSVRRQSGVVRLGRGRGAGPPGLGDAVARAQAEVRIGPQHRRDPVAVFAPRK